jgi:CRISPR/Cas system-associated protein Cas10 (large subunit of type III CRISPR-Cas system)
MPNTPECTVCGRQSKLKPTCAENVFICDYCDKCFTRKSDFGAVREGLRHVRMLWDTEVQTRLEDR